jgi:hypothetical protein
MSTPTAELVLAINGLGAMDREPILASMYRHLAHWPAYLALVISDCDCHRLMMMYDQHAHLSEIRDQMNDILQVGPTKPSLQARLAWMGSAISGMRDSVIEPHSPDRPI